MCLKCFVNGLISVCFIYINNCLMNRIVKVRIYWTNYLTGPLPLLLLLKVVVYYYYYPAHLSARFPPSAVASSTGYRYEAWRYRYEAIGMRHDATGVVALRSVMALRSVQVVALRSVQHDVSPYLRWGGKGDTITLDPWPWCLQVKRLPGANGEESW